MKKVALGAVVALLLAAFPLATSASAVNAAGTSTASVAWVGGNISGRLFVDGAAGQDPVAPGTFAADITLTVGIHTIIACPSTDTAVILGQCSPSGDTTGFPGDVQITTGGTNYTVVLTGSDANGPDVDVFQNDFSQTTNKMTRITYNQASDNADLIPMSSVCVDALTRSTPAVFDGEQANPFLVPSEQNALLGFGPFSGACEAPVFTIPNFTLPQGTNVVITMVNGQGTDRECLGNVGVVGGAKPAAFPADCTFVPMFQFLNVGEQTVPNAPDVEDFCANIIPLSGVQASLKALIGNVVPGDSNTYPSVGQVKAFVDNTQAILDAGDASVPGTIAPQWQLQTASLRSLLFAFTAVGYNFGLFPVPVQAALVHGANGQSLPGITPDLLTVSAGTVLADFVVSTCPGASPTPTPTPTPAPAPASTVAATPHFTG